MNELAVAEQMITRSSAGRIRRTLPGIKVPIGKCSFSQILGYLPTDQESGNDKEYVNASIPCSNLRYTRVIKDDTHNCNRSQTIKFYSILHSFLYIFNCDVAILLLRIVTMDQEQTARQ